jgi:predicted ribosome quality control (RQC) complex YloA/Tae2 family protein
MSERPTPETDAFIVQNTTNEGPTGVKWRSHAERLERERDEAREEAKRLEGAYEDATNYYARIIELVDERDKFRNALREIASATGFDNIGNWARNTARKALEETE